MKRTELLNSCTARAELARLERELSRAMGQCMGDFELLADGDRVMVCVSGGKDSYTLLELLERLRVRAPIRFELVAVHLDQGHPGYDGTPLRRWLQNHGYEHRILREDTYRIVQEKLRPGAAPCSLCSRLRRGILYNVAEELGCNKLALGHHRDDTLETLLLNLMFNGSLKAMPAKLVSDDGRNTVIRPLLYAAEASIERYARLRAYPIIPCDLCGSERHLKRRQVKRWLADMDRLAPLARQSMLAALANVRPTHLLDQRLPRSPRAAEQAELDASIPEPRAAGTREARGAGRALDCGALFRLPLLR